MKDAPSGSRKSSEVKAELAEDPPVQELSLHEDGEEETIGVRRRKPRCVSSLFSRLGDGVAGVFQKFSGFWHQ